MIYLGIIGTICSILSLLINYHVQKEKLHDPIKKLNSSILKLYSSREFKMSNNIFFTILTLTLIFIGFFTGFAAWVLKFNQSTLGLFVGLSIFSLILICSIIINFMNQEIID
jgi:Na+/melibiose symporter-like transporter